MIEFKIKPFIKQLTKNKQFSIVTILGFSISLTFVLLLSSYVKQELSVDHFHAKKDRIYRLVTETGSIFCPPFGSWLSELYPEVESYTRIFNGRDIIQDAKGEKHQLNYLLADTTFFQIFSYKILEGNPATCFTAKDQMVLSESYANKIYPNKSAIGEVIHINDLSFTVTAIVEDFGSNTQIYPCDALINFPVLADFWGYPELIQDWGNCSFSYYVLAKENTDLPSKEADVLAKCKEDFWLYKRGYAKVFKFESLTDAYFSSYASDGKIRQNDKTVVMILLSIVAFILILSIINYINLSVAQTSFRAKEAAIKKLMGGTRVGLFNQFILESLLLTLIASVIAFFLALLVEPWFNQLVNTKMSIMKMFSLDFLFIFVGMIVLIAIVSGIFPALILSKYKPLEVVKGNFRRTSKGTYTKLLISFQYIVVIVLLVSSITVYKQTNYMITYDLGFEKDNIIMVENILEKSKLKALKAEWLKIPGVEMVSFVAGSPLDGGNNQSFDYNDKPVSFQEFIVDSAFFEMFDIKCTPTSAAYSEDAIYLNQKVVDNLGLEKLPVSFKRYRDEVPVIGVLDNFHFRDLHQELGMLMVRQMKDDSPWQLFVKISGGNLKNTVNQIEDVYSKFSEGAPIDLRFIDEEINSWYQSERNASTIVAIFTLLSILLSVMGLMAISTYFIQQRVKEIGIRKVNGASVMEVITMLNWAFLKWVVIAIIIAIPLAYFSMGYWLENFVYKVDLAWGIFVLSAISAFVIALLTISLQSRAAARRNPIESLRYE